MADISDVRPPATGRATATWRERYGDQRLAVTVDPNRRDPATEFHVELDRRWGPQLGDSRRQTFWLPRAGAEELLDALTAALAWVDSDAPTTDHTSPTEETTP